MLPTGGPEVKTVLVFTASGDVSDYTPAIVNSLETMFADLAGVIKDMVTVTVTSASVVITVEIRSSASAGPTVLSRLQATVGTSAGATAFLSGVPGITITVLSVDSLSTVEAQSTSSKKEDNTGAIVGGILGGLAGLGLLVLGIFMYKRGQCPLGGSSKLAKVVVAPPDAEEKRTAPTSTTLGSPLPPSGGDRLLDKLAAADAHEGGTAPPSTSASEAAPAPAPAAPSDDASKGPAVLPPIVAGVAVGVDMREGYVPGAQDNFVGSHVVEIEFVASGSVEDYEDEAVKSNILSVLATAAGLSSVPAGSTLDVSAASVRLVAKLRVTSLLQAEAAQADLASTVGSASALEALLNGNPVLAFITVESDPTFKAVDASGQDNGNGDGDAFPVEAAVGGVAGGVAILVAILVCLIRRRSSQGGPENGKPRAV